MSRDLSHLGPPDRWLRCPRYGTKLEKFLPFKTPLDSRYDSQVPEVYRFTPEMFIQKWKSNKIKLGLVVDLTNTDRFYNREIFKSEGVEYVKHKLKGHGEAPTVQQTQSFIKLVEDFLNLNPMSFIAVHCTHGFNRTGFLICSYLVEALDWSIDAAVEAYANVRPPGIYKQQYVDELYERYDGSKENAWMCTEILPDWCFDDLNEQQILSGHKASLDDDAVDGQQSADGEIPQDEVPGVDSRQKVFIDSDEIDQRFRREELVVQIFDQPRLGKIQRLAKQYAKTDKNGFIGSQPVSMDRANIKLLKEKCYHVSWKADGTRYLLMIVGKGQIFMLDRDNCVFHIKNLLFPKLRDINMHLEKCLFDGELTVDKFPDPHKKDENGKPVMIEQPTFYIYDAITYKDNAVGQLPFDRRLECINCEIIQARNKAKMKGLILQEPFKIRFKEFRSIQANRGEKWREFTTPEFLKSRPHETDGLIFQPSDKTDGYMFGRTDTILKWKPPELNTIDFKLVIKKTRLEVGMLQEKIGLLYVSGREDPLDNIHPITPQLSKLDGKIIECRYEFGVTTKIENGVKIKKPVPLGWKFLRERTDKSFPNHISTAEGVRKSILEPVTLENLLNYINRFRYIEPVKPMLPPQPKPSNPPTAKRQLDGPQAIDGPNKRLRI